MWVLSQKRKIAGLRIVQEQGGFTLFFLDEKGFSDLTIDNLPARVLCGNTLIRLKVCHEQG